MVMLYFSDVMLTSIENLSHVNNSSTNTIKNSNEKAEFNNGGSSAAAAAGAAAVAANNGNKVAKAVLICHPNSHCFCDRTLTLDKPIKIGRSVGHNKTSANNGIFDCKVLSRNHALLWYEDDGRFLLRDTRSSNGTFVNTERLSKSGEESPPKQVFSGDTVQFGVDVVENSRNVTHGCVIATLKLFLPNGREAKATPSALASGHSSKVTLEDLYHLNQYLQDSLQREQMLESKLSSLQMLMKTLRESTELSWKALISNNSLLSRVELLEVQLKCYSKKFAEDTLREELRILQEDKSAYENVVKQYFQKILDEKIEVTQQCQDLNRALANAKTELANTQLLLSACQADLRELALKNTVQEKTVEELEAKLQQSDERAQDAVAKVADENMLLYDQIKGLSNAEKVLQQTIKELETHGDYAHKQVMSLQSQVEELQKHHRDILCELVDPASIKDRINDVELVKSWTAVYMAALRKCRENTALVRKRVEHLSCDKASMQQKTMLLECELDKCAIELQDCREEQAVLEAKIMERKTELDVFKPVPDILDELSLEGKCGAGGGVMPNENEVLNMQEQHKLLNVIQRDISGIEERYKELESLLKSAKDELMKITVSYAIEEDKLDLYEKQMANLETAVRTLNEHVENLEAYPKEAVCIEDVQSLKKQLFEAHETAQQRQNVTVELMKHFSQFVALVNRKLDVVEATAGGGSADGGGSAILDGDLSAAQELNLLKLESGSLVEAVNELQKSLESVSLRNGVLDDVVDCPPTLAAGGQRRSSSSPPPQPLLEDDLIVIFKEKLRCLEKEKTLLENKLVALQQQYDYLKSYPYFDLYFILPIVLLILVVIFNFGDKLSYLFGTWG